MDWARYLRAMDAGRMETIEDKRLAQMNGKIKAADIAPDEWAAIRENDRIADGN